MPCPCTHPARKYFSGLATPCTTRNCKKPDIMRLLIRAGSAQEFGLLTTRWEQQPAKCQTDTLSIKRRFYHPHISEKIMRAPSLRSENREPFSEQETRDETPLLFKIRWSSCIDRAIENLSTPLKKKVFQSKYPREF